MDNSHRKPYRTPVKRLWWLKNRVYLKYMIRELTAVFCLWVAVELLILCIALNCSADPGLWISEFVQKPWVIGLNIVSLAAILFHAVTWFSIMPKAVRVFRSKRPDDTRLVPAKAWIALLYAVMLVASAIIFLVFTFA